MNKCHLVTQSYNVISGKNNVLQSNSEDTEEAYVKMVLRIVNVT